MKPTITAIILTFNEEIHIQRCIERLRPLVERIVVVDSFSTDKTVEMARAMGAEVLQNPFSNHAAQFQWALDNAAIKTDWTLRIDADEYLEPELMTALTRALAEPSETVIAYAFHLKVIFKGKFIRWGGYYRTWLVRLWRTGQGQMEQRWMDERMIIASGETVRLKGGDLVDESLKDIGWWTDKHNGYATRQMVDFIGREYPLFNRDNRLEKDEGVARVRRFLRNAVYGHAPLYLRAVLYFVQRYFFRLGFLDGRMGFVWHFLQGFWYFVLMDAKIDEARRFIRDHGLEAFRQHLADKHGIIGLAPVEPS